MKNKGPGEKCGLGPCFSHVSIYLRFHLLSLGEKVDDTQNNCIFKLKVRLFDSSSYHFLPITTHGLQHQRKALEAPKGEHYFNPNYDCCLDVPRGRKYRAPIHHVEVPPPVCCLYSPVIKSSVLLLDPQILALLFILLFLFG